MKRFFGNAMLGALVGIALQYLLSICISVKLNLGYLMAYVATLAEAVGGEMRAVILEAALSGWLGMGVALAFSFGRQRAWPARRRYALAGVALCVGIVPAAIAIAFALYGLV